MQDFRLTKGNHTAVCTVEFAKALLKTQAFATTLGYEKNGVYHNSDFGRENYPARYQLFMRDNGIAFATGISSVVIDDDVIFLMGEVKKFIEEVRNLPQVVTFGRFQVQVNVGREPRRIAEITSNGRDAGYIYAKHITGSHGSVNQAVIDLEEFFEQSWIEITDVPHLQTILVWAQKYIDENKIGA